MLNSAVQLANGELEEIQHKLEFLGAALKVNSLAGPLLGVTVGRPDLQPAIEDFRRKRVNDLTVVYQGLYVEAFSVYERFVRSLLVEYVEEVARLDVSYEKLKTRGVFIQKHILQTGIALQQVFENRTNTVLDFDLLAKNLATVAPNSTKVKLNSNAFVLQLATFSSSGLENALGKVGIVVANFFEELAKGGELKNYFGTNGVKDVSKNTKKLIDEIVQTRNHLVHRGDMRRSVSETDVSDLVRFLIAFHPRLASVVSSFL